MSIVGGAITNLFVRFTADTSPLKRGFDTLGQEVTLAENKFTRAGGRMSAAGKKMSMAVTLPLLAVGAAAIKSAVDFEQSFTRIEALVGVAADEIEGMKSAVLGLAGETGRGPQELADALYFITSAGIEGSAALDVLEASAKAAAVGLGDTATIADLVTSAVNAYGIESLSAAEATDTLVAAVRYGKLEPDELAGAMGRVLPIASAMGVEFTEISAAFAAMSRTGTNANEAATQLRGIMSGLLSPSSQAEEALAGVGLSVEGVQRSLREDGLLSTLELLKERLGGNASATEAVFGNIRALSGVMDLLGSNSETTTEIFDQMQDSTGMLADAFAATADDPAMQFQQALADVQAALIGVGNILLPVVTDIAKALGSLVSGFQSMPGSAQTLIVVFGAVAAAAGPLLYVVGSLITAWGKLTQVIATNKFAQAAAGMRNLRMAAGYMAAGLAAAAAAWIATDMAINKMADDGKRAANDALEPLRRQMAEGSLTAEEFAAKVEALRVGYNELAEEQNARVDNSSLLNPFDDKARIEGEAGVKVMLEQLQAMSALEEQAAALSSATGQNRDVTIEWVQEQYAAGRSFSSTEVALEAFNTELLAGTDLTPKQKAALLDMNQEFTNAEVEIQAAKDALQEYNDALRAQFDPVFAMQDAMFGMEDAIRGEADARLALAEAYASGDPAAVAQATRDLEQAQLDQTRAAVDAQVAAGELNTAMENGDVTADEVAAAIDGWTSSMGLTGTAADTAKARFLELMAKAQELDGLRPEVTVAVDTSGAEAAFARLQGIFGWGASRPVFGPPTMPQRRAVGGPLLPHGDYIAGEGGHPELIRMGATGGMAVPLSGGDLHGLAAGGSTLTAGPAAGGGTDGRGGDHFTVEVPVTLDSERIGKATAKFLRNDRRRKG